MTIKITGDVRKAKLTVVIVAIMNPNNKINFLPNLSDKRPKKPCRRDDPKF